MTLKVETAVHGTLFTVTLSGLFDYSTIDDFSFDIPAGISKIAVNFAEVDFIDSTGIGSILGIIHMASEKSLEVEFTGLNESTRVLFETLGVFKVMEALLKEGL